MAVTGLEGAAVTAWVALSSVGEGDEDLGERVEVVDPVADQTQSKVDRWSERAAPTGSSIGQRYACYRF